MVVIISTSVDTATDAVIRELDGAGIDHFRFNTEEYPYKGRLTNRINDEEQRVRLGPGGPLNHATSIWFRRLRTPHPPEEVASGIHEYCINEARAALVGSLLGSDGRVMSNPHAIWRAEHKCEQLIVAKKIGFTIPPTTITNDPEEVRQAFARSNGRLVVKPVRRGYVCLGEGDERAVFTSRVREEDLERVDSAQLAPAIYQNLVEKACDVRVTYVDGNLFTAEIDSQSDPEALIDWRRTRDPNLAHRVATLPESVSRMIIELMARLDLRFGAIDLIKTPESNYKFLEVNPNGQWLWLDDQLGFGISRKIADWLAGSS